MASSYLKFDFDLSYFMNTESILVLLKVKFRKIKFYSFTGRGCLSGFGFELTFRLRKQEDEQSPPMWPTTLLNKLAAYVFHTGKFYKYQIYQMWCSITKPMLNCAH